jgi:tetratricopeptide (TPR) repeat protein
VLTSLLALFRGRGIVNSRFVRVRAGLGALCLHQGRYEEAKLEFEAGYALAARLGNESQQSNHAAHLALCYLRLGEYRELLEWSRKAGQISLFSKIQLPYYQAFALAMLGDSSAAIQTFDSLEFRLPPMSPAWLIQAQKLLRADILQLCGYHTAALEQARDAVSWPKPVLHEPAFAGTFARWLALLSKGENDYCAAEYVINTLSAKMTELDAIDRVELTCARLMLGWPNSLELEDQLRVYLADLPPAVAAQLMRLGAIGN